MKIVHRFKKSDIFNLLFLMTLTLKFSKIYSRSALFGSHSKYCDINLYIKHK